ncbi:S8 family serine peptidase [Candidatus Palauibacter soopunensis]|uniref:S8 family serine peptidase n=1 Tax=Candidatus Palauibacter soopunensis TaxID=3056739 RepID=UPI0023A02F89|nr:S8 family serine peptidase [Candidatus Palauibacter soopunensis]MDE2878455.1 S8 family serine peptidase [Candidatus Palauibacter soopunensis]
MSAEPLRSRTGRGVSIAVVDSGAHPNHPHLGLLAGGVAFTPDGRERDDLTDRLGHGTAVTAAIQEKAPGARVHVARVFHDELATSARTLAKAIDWAAERGCRLANLSLGTPRRSRIEVLQPAVERAARAGTLVIAAYSHEGQLQFPGSLPGALGVCLDWDLPRHRVRIGRRDGRRVLYASGYPRPIPGVPPTRNLNGISFAVANATGIVALALDLLPEARRRADALAALEPLAAV